jgi:hypothetical protein
VGEHDLKSIVQHPELGTGDEVVGVDIGCAVGAVGEFHTGDGVLGGAVIGATGDGVVG